MNDAVESAPGFHGKLVAKGDFVTRRLPRGFVGPWDSWLQDVVGGSRDRMGEAWLDAYLTSPIWRFVLSAGLCSDAAAAGVLMPSVDRVGRYFPLTIVAMLPHGSHPVGVPVAAAEWFGHAESLARSALDDGFDFDDFDARVAALGIPSAEAPASAMDADVSSPERAGQALRLSIPSADSVGHAYWNLAGRFLAASYPNCSVWWTSGSEAVGATFLVCGGLPGAAGFGAFLDGRWDHWGWGNGAAVLAPAEAQP